MYVGVMFYGSWPLISKSCIDQVRYLTNCRDHASIPAHKSVIHVLHRFSLQNLLNNFGADDLSAFIARVFLFIQLITAFPFIVFVLRVQLMQFLFSSVWPRLVKPFRYSISLQTQLHTLSVKTWGVVLSCRHVIDGQCSSCSCMLIGC